MMNATWHLLTGCSAPAAKGSCMKFCRMKDKRSKPPELHVHKRQDVELMLKVTVKIRQGWSISSDLRNSRTLSSFALMPGI